MVDLIEGAKVFGLVEGGASDGCDDTWFTRKEAEVCFVLDKRRVLADIAAAHGNQELCQSLVEGVQGMVGENIDYAQTLIKFLNEKSSDESVSSGVRRGVDVLIQKMNEAYTQFDSVMLIPYDGFKLVKLPSKQSIRTLEV